VQVVWREIQRAVMGEVVRWRDEEVRQWVGWDFVVGMTGDVSSVVRSRVKLIFSKTSSHSKVVDSEE
jgi:hypothetical protein